LMERGFSANHPAEFIAWVAEDNNALVGYAVAYTIPFTFDLRPTVVLKELFVEEQARSAQQGSLLFAAVVQFSRLINARLLRWQVLPSNASAKHFYDSRGGKFESGWESWILDLESASLD
jgi:GNAT superfamily N-acetyltransferase